MNDETIVPASDVPASEHFSQEPASEHQQSAGQYSWLRGFVDIITDPEELASRRVLYPVKVISFAILLYALAGVGITYLQLSNDVLREQRTIMVVKPMESRLQRAGVPESKIEEQVEALRDNMQFQFVRTLGISVVSGVIAIFVLGSIFWILQRLFNPEPPPFSVIVSLYSYSTSLTFLGYMITGLLQYAGNSLVMAPNLSFLAMPMAEHANVFQFLEALTIFTIWEYIVVGWVVGRHIGMSRQKGMMIGATALLIRCCILGGGVYMVTALFG